MFYAFLRRAIPIKLSIPEPNNHTAAGIGTAATLKVMLSIDTLAFPNPLLKALSPLPKTTAASPGAKPLTVAEVLHEPERKLLNMKGYTLRAMPLTSNAPVCCKIVESNRLSKLPDTFIVTLGSVTPACGTMSNILPKSLSDMVPVAINGNVKSGK